MKQQTCTVLTEVLVVMTIALLLFGCSDRRNAKTEKGDAVAVSDFKVCYDEILYFTSTDYTTAGSTTFITSPVIDKETLLPKRCSK